MNKEIKILLRKGSVFMLPIIAWIYIVIVVDPFNYFNVSNFISEKAKEKSAQQLNSLLYNTVNFRNNPTNSIIIGDSRIRKLPTEKIKQLTGDDYYTMHSNAAKLNEIIDLFWFSDSLWCSDNYTNLENVIIGINFNLYNEYAYSNRVTDVKKILDNKFIYIFNWNILETIYLALKNEFFGLKPNEKKDKEEFWDYTIKTIAKNHYSKYKHPKETLLRLEEMGAYCKANDINLILLIVPHYKEFHNRLVEFDLAEEENAYKNEIKNIGRVIDYDFPNSITNCKSCFSDPIHTTDSIGEIMVNEIFSDSLTIGRGL
jgi:hypothetical protein